MNAVGVRFLQPLYALTEEEASRGWRSAVAETPGEDARGRLFIARRDAAGLTARFSVFGPPVVVACFDWVCEQVERLPETQVRGLTALNIEQALALTATQRYASVMAIDALNDALITLE